MSILSVVYASAPTSEVLILTLEISRPGADPIRICNGFEDQTLTLETAEAVTFEAAGLDISLPPKDTSGQQNLTFVIDNVTGVAQAYLDDAISDGEAVTVTYRCYLASDLSAPAEPPTVMTLAGAQFERSTVQITAGYYDLLNTAWPRRRYTDDFAPGLKYL